MRVLDIIERRSPASSVTEANGIPWFRNDFSERILKEHLTQEHDMVSRNIELIKKQVDWIHSVILKEKTSKILNLCCGPGLYTNMLAKYGHRCKGIDFSPAAIEYAHITKIELMLDCEYILADIRKVGFGNDFDFAMQLFGEFNTKTKEESSQILKNLNSALKEGGLLLLELYSHDTIQELGERVPSWETQKEGDFSSEPYLLLKDHEWVHNESYSVNRFHVIHSGSNKIELFTERLQAYTYSEYEKLFAKNGFSIVSKLPSLANEKDKTGFNMFALLLKKTA